MNEIFEITEKIQKRFPALYEHLSETPLFIIYHEEEISNVDFEQYLESLKAQWMIFNEKKNHKRQYQYYQYCGLINSFIK